MKTWTALFLLAALASFGMAQEDPLPAPEGPPFGRGPGPQDAFRQRASERWLDQLRERDPALYEELKHLREHDPQGFRREIRRRIRQERGRLFMEQHPSLQAIAEKLSEDEKRALLEAIMSGPGRGGPRGGRPGAARGEQVGRLDAETKQLAEAYRSADGAEARQAARSALREKLFELFDAREAARQAHLQHMEKKLAQIGDQLEARRENRNEIVERRLLEMTGEDPLAW